MKKKINRYPKKFFYRYYIKGKKIFAIDRKSFKKKYKCNKIIRLHKNDFKLINKNTKFLTHFNIQDSGHVPGRKYLIVKVFRTGYLGAKINRPPILDLKHAFIAKCLYAKSNIPYKKLNKKIFRYSLKNIKNISNLKKAILRRYKKSLAHYSNKDKISLGVGITKLKIIKEIRTK